jgi:N-acetylmuramoyl-L-alanine amidase
VIPDGRGHPSPFLILGAVSACAALVAAAGSGSVAASRLGAGRSAADPKPAERLDRPAAPAGAPEKRAGAWGAADRLAAGEKVVPNPPDDLFLEVTVPDRGATDAWLGQYLLSPARAAALRKSYGAGFPAPGRPLRIHVADLNDSYRYKVARDLFPADGPREGGWLHRVGAGRLTAKNESVRLLARLYTEGPENATLLASLNAAAGKSLLPAQEILVPGPLLHAAFTRGRGVTPSQVATAGEPSERLEELPPLEATPQGQAPRVDAAPSATADAQAPVEPEDDFTEAPAAGEGEEEGPAPAPLARPPVAEGAGDLTYGQDDSGRYAAYPLKRGEALYSAVVVRFTGRIDVQEVNDLAVRIAQRSRIENVMNIPIGFKVRIPLDDLLPEYLPPGDPRRQAWERQHAEVARYTNMATSRDLQGVAVILDAGHGGRDVGAFHNGVWEHDYVYDILCRIRARLGQATGARVLPIIRDRKEGFQIRDTDRLSRSRAEVLLTNPPFALTERAPSVNLRWYLSNAYFRQLLKEGFDPLKIVFTSLHADARHPSLAGAMVYVPGEEFRRGRYGHSGAVYARHREVREEPYVAFTRDQRERSEGLSRQFAATLVDAFRAGDVAVHPYQPVRERIIRRGRSWVPAVLRCNIVPVEVLIEVANLSNRPDSRRLADPGYRQKVAEAYVDALLRYFSGSNRKPAVQAAGGGR